MFRGHCKRSVQVDAEPASRRNNNARAVLLRRSPPQHSGWLEHHHNNNKPVSGRQQGKYEADRKRDTSAGALGRKYEGVGGGKTHRTFHCACCATDHFQRVKNRKFAANYSNSIGCKPTVLPALRENFEHHSYFLEPPALDVPGLLLLLPHVYCLLHTSTAF